MRAAMVARGLICAITICVVLAIAAIHAGARAEDVAQFPTKPVSVVVPSSAGGSVELQVRIVAEIFREALGQPIVVVNRPGAMGSLGATFVYRAAPDGYTLLASPNSPMVFNPLTRKALSYDPGKFTPVVLLGTQPLVMGVRGDFPGKTLGDLVAYGKAHPGKTYYGSQGVGGGNHMASMLFAKHTNTDLKHVPFPGAGPAAQALMKGEVDFFMAPLAVLLPWYRDNKLKILAVGSKARVQDAPNAPTFRELGYPEDFILTVWSVIVAPPGTPAPIVQKLNGAFNAALADPKAKERFKQLAVDPGGGAAVELAAMLKRESATWTRVAAENNIRKE